MASDLGGSQISSLLETLPGIASVLRSPVADALISVIRAAAGTADFDEDDAEELIRYAIRRGLVGAEEGEQVLEEVQSSPRPKARQGKPEPKPVPTKAHAPRPVTPPKVKAKKAKAPAPKPKSKTKSKAKAKAKTVKAKPKPKTVKKPARKPARSSARVKKKAPPKPVRRKR